MKLYYNDVDITDQVGVKEAVYHDCSYDKCDTLEITLDDAGAWYMWKPTVGDRVSMVHNGYETGTMYVHSVIPKGREYRLLATGLQPYGHRKRWKIYKNMTLKAIMDEIGAESGMDVDAYGVDTDIVYRQILRRNETGAAFLSRLLMYEGAVMKCAFGKITAIGIGYAQQLEPVAKISTDTMLSAVKYESSDGERWGSIRVYGRYGNVRAMDTQWDSGDECVVSDMIPATDSAEAKRWADNVLLCHDRQCEVLKLKSSFNPGFTAMGRIDIRSASDMNGEWICDEAMHDFINERSEATLMRCIYTIE